MAPLSLPTIKELPENVKHKIAAGEVVERPVSVVKELVENSIDAGARRIQISIKKGGMDSISISDDGHGIPAGQIPLALKRHATSKISDAEDLFSLQTLGFRGEALASIASVSKFRLESATDKTDPIGYVLEVREGKPENLKETPMPRGTRVLVEDLFCTTPARRKFLKRPETEWGHIMDLVTALALGYLHLEWTVEHNGKKVIFCPPTQDPLRRILDLFGKDARENLYTVERTVSELELRGLISHPNFCKKSNRHLFVYINGRYIQDRLVNHAIVHGYRNLLMQKQYPMVVLNLQLDPKLVDVNVHPTKREVRFSNGNAIHNLISETIYRRLEEAPWKTQGTVSHRTEEHLSFGMKKDETPSQLPRPGPRDLKKIQSGGEGWPGGNWPRLPHEGEIEESPRTPIPLENLSPPQAKIGTLPFAQLQLIGQFLLTYLVCEHEGSLILIDQHAAHERIGFEKLKSSFGSGGLSRQNLLNPISFDLPPAESDRLRACLSSLEPYGLQVEEFGEHSFVIKAVPTLIKKCDWIQMMGDLVDKIEGEGRLKGLEEKVDHVLATMACHRQIRAGDRLSREEMQALLKQLEGTPRGYHCPHGRPVMVEIRSAEIEKWFKRTL